MQVISIDRFEGEYAVCELENGRMINIEKNKFLYPVEEGDIINIELEYVNGDISNIRIYGKNEEEKQRRLQIIRNRLKRIKRK